ncbi:MAG: hypothetical protein KAU14_06455, partial [Thermoplasmata archaeon]|nr:hypothetical protein [Thermoplasmata archaeon]
DDPKAHIEKRFNEYIIANRDYNVRQLEFLTLLKKVFSERKWIELPDFAKDPLREEHPLDYFEFGELENIVKRCNEIKIV